MSSSRDKLQHTTGHPTWLARLWDSQLFWKVSLVIAALLWGASYVVTKEVAQAIQPWWLVALRFIPTTLVCAVVLRRRLFSATERARASRRFGVVLGSTTVIGYVLQTYGILYTTPGRNAFLSGVYCILVPFVTWTLGMGKPERKNLLAAVLAVVGLGFISLEGLSLTFNLGDALSLATAVSWSVGMGLTARDGAKLDMWVVTVINFLVVSVASLAGALVFEPFPVAALTTPHIVAGLVFLALVCTLSNTFVFNFAMTKLDPAEGSLLSSLEAPSGAAVSIAAGQESLAPRVLIGFAFMSVAVVISQATELVSRWVAKCRQR